MALFMLKSFRKYCLSYCLKIGVRGNKNIVFPASQLPKSFLFFALSATYSFRGLLMRTKSLGKI